MFSQYFTSTAAILGIIESLLLIAWDIFFLFVCFQPGVFGSSHDVWLALFNLLTKDVNYGVKAVVIISSILNFSWFVSSIAALLSNGYSKSNASGLRIWIAVTLAIVCADIGSTVFITLTTTVQFEDLFRHEKQFQLMFNSTIFEVGNQVKEFSEFGSDIYKGYVWFLVGASRFFLTSVILNLILVYFVFRRIGEIRLGPQRKHEKQGIDNSAFITPSIPATPNMYSETSYVQYEEPVFDTFRTQNSSVNDIYAVPNRFRLSTDPVQVRRSDSRRRASARNYDLGIDVPHNAAYANDSYYGSTPSAPAIRAVIAPSRNQLMPAIYPDIPEVDYDNGPIENTFATPYGARNQAMNPNYGKSNWGHEPRTFLSSARSPSGEYSRNDQSKPAFPNFNGHKNGNIGGRRY